MRFKDKVALITAVGSGIGRATATIMANEGAVIVGVDNEQRRLDMAIEEINMTGGRAFGRCIDALVQAEVDETVAWAAKNYGIDILVNAVGGSTMIEKPGAAVDELTCRTLTERIRPRWNQQSPEDQAAEIERTPLRRVAEAADQAKVICFLASSDADFVTGLTIDVTGGL